MTVLCYPLIFEVSEFYLYRDMALLIDDIKTELAFVSRYWRLSGRPTVCLLVREEHMRYLLFITLHIANKLFFITIFVVSNFVSDLEFKWEEKQKSY